MPETRINSEGSPGAVFPTTHWSVVLEAGRDDSPQAGAALEQLCRVYWYPLYAYVRRRGHSAEDAQDLTQEYFLRLLQSPFLSRADRAKGKFRSFLLAALEHFLAKEWRRAHRQKRGSGRQLVSLDELPAEQRYRLEPPDELTAEMLYNQTWALTLLEGAMAALRQEWEAAGKGPLFEELQSTLQGERPDRPYASVAARMGMGEGAVRMAAHRLRQRYGELLRAHVAQTVGDPGEIDGEIRFLFAALPR
jgi:RNA polymerase sigma-70 factor (ECF subfamily)